MHCEFAGAREPKEELKGLQVSWKYPEIQEPSGIYVLKFFRKARAMRVCHTGGLLIETNWIVSKHTLPTLNFKVVYIMGGVHFCELIVWHNNDVINLLAKWWMTRPWEQHAGPAYQIEISSNSNQ